MDPVTTATTVITFATALKDVVQLAMAFSNSLDKIPWDIQSLKDDAAYIVDLVGELQVRTSLSNGSTNMGDDATHHIDNLRTGLVSLHKQHVQLLQDFMDPRFRSWVWVPLGLDQARRRLWMWYKREDTAGEVLRLRKLVERLEKRFFFVEALQAQKHRDMAEKTQSLLLLETPAGKEAFSHRTFVRYISDQASDLPKLLHHQSADCRCHRFSMILHMRHF